MKAFRLKFKDGSFKILFAESTIALIRKYDLCTKEHISTRIEQLSGEQEAIAFSNRE